MNYKILILIGCLTSSNIAIASKKNVASTDETEWTVGISGGVAIVNQASDQSFGSMSLSKDFGDSYAGLDVTYIDSGSVQGLIGSIPASTLEATISTGTSFEAFNIDGYLSFGKRNFDVEAVSRNGQSVSINSNGNSFGVGGSLSYDFLISERSFLTPVASIDYNKLDIARIASLPNGDFVAVENSEDGITGTFGLAFQHLFGKDDQHLISILSNAVTTSNTTSFNPGNGQYPVLRALASREVPGQKDGWAEIGGSVSFKLSQNFRLDLSAVRTIGFLNSDVTSVSTGLRFAF